jgi:hypothetical protein
MNFSHLLITSQFCPVLGQNCTKYGSKTALNMRAKTAPKYGDQNSTKYGAKTALKTQAKTALSMGPKQH